MNPENVYICVVGNPGKGKSLLKSGLEQFLKHNNIPFEPNPIVELASLMETIKNHLDGHVTEIKLEQLKEPKIDNPS